jgi:predicted nucleic acid-binding protein
VNAYVDSSVVLRLILGELRPLREWRELTLGVTSALTEVECLRTLDRRHLNGAMTRHELVSGREAVFRFVESLEVVDLARPVLQRASQPFPTPLGTLDALHLATALLWREQHSDLAMATHDMQLALAAKASGLAVMG